MLSGNGRHRRPRQAPALVVAAGVTGSAIAIPLLGATGAHAADGANWDRVAECETGGAWSQNSGNGYYGGLQISQEAWESYGGLAYAPSADEASRAQQIRIAEKIHADQGIAAWPTCGPLAGLGNDSGKAAGSATGDGASKGTDAPGATKTTRTPKPSDSSASSDTPDSSGASAPPKGLNGSTAPEPSGSPEASESPAPSAATGAKKPSSSPSSSTSPSMTASDAPSDATELPGNSDTSSESGTEAAIEPQGADGTSGAGRHRGGSAAEGAVDGRTADSSGRHASRGAGEPREVVDGQYTVHTGDSLWHIADSLDLDGGWHSLYDGNKDVVGTDPDYILPGQKLTVAGESGENQG